MFESLSLTASLVLTELAERRVGAHQSAVRDLGEIERVAWLRATDQKRRIDASLLTENYSRYWNVRAQSDEIARQEHLKKGREGSYKPSRSITHGGGTMRGIRLKS